MREQHTAEQEHQVPDDQPGPGVTLTTVPVSESNLVGSLHTLARYVVAAILLFYGFSKVVGLQFIVTESMLDMRLRDLGGLRLTWAYHGLSDVLRLGTAAVEIGTAGLLLFRRTARLGILAAVVVVAQLVMVNLAYPIAPGVVIVLVAATAGLVAMEWPALRALARTYALQPPAVGADPTRGPIPRPAWAKALVVVVLLGGSVGFHLWQSAAIPDPQLSGVWLAPGDEEIDRFYVDEAPFCGVRPVDQEQIWRGVCFIDEDEGTLEGELVRGPTPDGGVWQLDADFRLGADGERLHLDDHVRDVEVELQKLR